MKEFESNFLIIIQRKRAQELLIICQISTFNFTGLRLFSVFWHHNIQSSMKKPSVLLLCSILFLFSSFQVLPIIKGNVRTADVIIYGGTSAAITAAVQVKKMGKSVIVVSPDQHLGGLSAGGLGYTDTGNKEVIGGLSREFYQRLYTHYHKPEAWKWQKQIEYGNQGQGTSATDGTNPYHVDF